MAKYDRASATATPGIAIFDSAADVPAGEAVPTLRTSETASLSPTAWPAEPPHPTMPIVSTQIDIVTNGERTARLFIARFPKPSRSHQVRVVGRLAAERLPIIAGLDGVHNKLFDRHPRRSSPSRVRRAECRTARR
ncbi:hypothetical protein IRT45_18795 [Nocardia sp. BSTN01]|uniref:hypothetical protein n=1 Tax=Nocardia sp. BSTN01 TaxID=2783665 RepID=UPI00188EA497|nr:hypothetical protein [Nocardia sp. BSTN01]MBF4999198.1 hypothetical protein [Nocardia sp. BSTN01]